MRQTAHPSDDLLHATLLQEIGSAEESQVVDHLSECEDCQRRITLLASDSDSCQQICHVLKRETLSTRSSENGLKDEAAIADFAVTFLEPSDREGSIGRLGEFEVLSVIGSGGMGIVLKGFQEELNRPVAIKVMSPHLATVALARKRFLREAQATAAIVHPNVMPILSVNESGTLPFLVMPFVTCHSLQQRVDSEGPLAISDVLRIAIQVAHGLSAAHAQGLVHRDVKPANILLERSVDRAMLTDFGLARAADDVTVTRSGVIAGTPAYMSPEQARGDVVDPRSDLFSLGCVIYTMSMGHAPFQAETSYGVLRKITDDDPIGMQGDDRQIPGWLQRLTFSLLAKNPAERPAASDQVAELLQQCLAHVQQPGVHSIPSFLQREGTIMKRKLFWAALFLLLGFPIVGLAYMAMSVQKQKAASERARQMQRLSSEIDAVRAAQAKADAEAKANSGLREIQSVDVGSEIESLQQTADQLLRELES